ncbi:MAG: glycosyltransferase [Ignavibacteriaceae bacterium]|jgi:Glycosyltransferases, probably involved in cell wall biogenesis|nr:MAG: glycosyltransferase [Chlorobiota bacterium]MBV6399434.1 hypothetical protein [Ignavibacteria bacterium]MCC6886722.1 glycosyltransferase [Ignavibacteriales bacterium]MCE7953139.1 glycosyltransferase [Chlorobi bacterium CHB7]MEB2329078.1 glycosyltransferase [Ignavibacteriaceae bacterium]OQY76613.1 MAG: hypothetical protein B6D43_10580 [Ignavibacteriales bacterium UTCHB1]RIK50014.1 MAG: hypothetical protein DCC60_01170 [Ignavibacteriota bacterium]
MGHILLPDWVKGHLWYYGNSNIPTKTDFERIRSKLTKLISPDPDITIAIPAFNEQNNIVRTLSSISESGTSMATEILVIDNNSTDKTGEIAESLGAKVINEPAQGVSFARQKGLLNAKGKYYISADADTIYPPGWIDEITKPLSDSNVACAYGIYSFIPPSDTTRIKFSLYEFARSILFWFKRRQKEYLLVRGANFSFRVLDGLKVGGFDTSDKVLEDGRMGLALSNLGALSFVGSEKARAWTAARRLTSEGNLSTAFLNRFKKEIKSEN